LIATRQLGVGPGGYGLMFAALVWGVVASQVGLLATFAVSAGLALVAAAIGARPA
jgi:hypothetical protein